MENRASLATGVGIGAALMYWLDPDRGRRRRALVRDRAVHLARLARDAAGATGRDLSQRGYGTAASIAGALTPRTDDDDILVARVRSKLGRVRSEERRVGKECRGRWPPEQYKRKSSRARAGREGRVRRRLTTGRQ